MTNKFKDFIDMALSFVGIGFGYLILFVAIAALAGGFVLLPILAVALPYWVMCLITHTVFSWTIPIAIGLTFLVTLSLAWYEGDSM